MADIKVRNLDDGVVARLKGRAEAQGVSLEEEVRRLLTRAVRDEREALIADIRELRSRQKPSSRSSVELIDEVREDMARRLGRR